MWLPGAVDDLDAILERRRAYSVVAAERLRDAIDRHARLLEDHAYLGRVIPEIGVEQLREVLESGFRIWYEVRTDRIEVFAVVHSRQDFRELHGQVAPDNS